MRNLLRTITGAVAMTMLAASALAAGADLEQRKDRAAIATLVESVATLADTGNFESLERLFADEVRVDYTSAFGGKPQLHSPQGLMTAWAGLLPGFERTRHTISGVRVVLGPGPDEAKATARVSAEHFLGGRRWLVRGDYAYTLARAPEGWRVAALTFRLAGEEGTREVLAQAAKAAAERPAPYLLRQRTRQAVLTFLGALEDKDMERLAGVWTEDSVQDMPFSPQGFPKRVAGRENLIRHYAAWPKVSGKADFTSGLVFHPMQDPERVFAEWRGQVEITTTGRLYDQRYGGLFHVVGGRIALFREYYDPIVFMKAFGLDEGGSFQGRAGTGR